ncbi:MAG: type II toxin-antitoxin system VapC family toxin [Candidatus Korarchaeota archaeon]|nr:type II toxin-antitoxin system VapC family toxin [Candidatus Korarchaeota archaeon]
MRLLLDTSFLLELRKGNEEAEKSLREESKDASDIGISVLTLYELLVGSHYVWMRRKDPRERIWLDNLLKWLTIYELREEVVRRAAEAKAEAMLEGMGLPDMDLLIALTVDGPAKLLTCDEDHKAMAYLLKKRDIQVVYITPKR